MAKEIPINRKELKHIKVWCSEEDKGMVKENADKVSMSQSRYLLSLGLGYVPKSTVDADTVLLLATINRNQTELAEALKGMKDKRSDKQVIEIDRLLSQIRQTQAELKRVAMAI